MRTPSRYLLVTALLTQTIFAAELHAQQLDASAPSEQPVPGFNSVDIGGRGLRYMCMGEGSPTVVIEAGGGTSMETVFSWNFPSGWPPIVRKVAQTTRVCVYDRAGLGRSDPRPLPRDSLQVAQDLHALLQRASVPGPYVIAGQSFGGMNARMFASEYPDAVAGMVLVDSSHPDTYPENAKVLPPPQPGEPAVLTGLRQGPDLSKTREWVDFAANAQLVRERGRPLGDKPLIVLVASPNAREPFIPEDVWQLVEPVHQRLQKQACLELSTRCKHIVAERAGHNIQRDEPQLVIDAILTVVNETRSAPTAAAPGGSVPK